MEGVNRLHRWRLAGSPVHVLVMACLLFVGLERRMPPALAARGEKPVVPVIPR
jgi:hypothetical protein